MILKYYWHLDNREGNYNVHTATDRLLHIANKVAIFSLFSLLYEIMGMGRWGVGVEHNQTSMHVFSDGCIAAWWLQHVLAKHRVKAILMWAHDCCYVGYGSNSSCPSSLWSTLILMVCMPSQLCKKVIPASVSYQLIRAKFLGQWSKC